MTRRFVVITRSISGGKLEPLPECRPDVKGYIAGPRLEPATLGLPKANWACSSACRAVRWVPGSTGRPSPKATTEKPW